MKPSPTLACARWGGSRRWREGSRSCRSIPAQPAQFVLGVTPARTEMDRLRLAFEAREAAVVVEGSGGRGRESRSTKGCKSSPPCPGCRGKSSSKGSPLPEVVGDQPPRLDLATRGGGRLVSSVQGTRGVASPRVRAYEPHTPEFRPSWSLYSKEGRTDLQLAIAAREGREGG